MIYFKLILISGKDEVIQVLLNAGAEINHQDYKGNTPLHYASLYGNLWERELRLCLLIPILIY